MSRRATPAAQEHAARQAALRTIARGERPVYRAMRAQDGQWYVDRQWQSLRQVDQRNQTRSHASRAS